MTSENTDKHDAPADDWQLRCTVTWDVADDDLPDPVHHGDVFARIAASNPAIKPF